MLYGFVRSTSNMEASMQLLTAEELMLEQYLAFCKNPLRDDITVANEYKYLMRLPGVQRVAFYSRDILMVGTHCISLKDPETGFVHSIGEFIIYLYRKRMGRVWDTGFCFENIRGTLHGYHHPHINVSTVLDLGDMGILCISRGQFHIYQHLRSGEMHIATQLLIDILKTYDQDRPFHGVENWPLLGGSAC